MFTYESPVNDKSLDFANRSKVSQLVRDHFCLGNEGFEKFNKQLFTPTLPEELVNLLGKDNTELRAKKAINADHYMESKDDGWKMFKRRFRSFVSFYSVTYKDFRKGKITINKNDVKIRKLIVKFYTNVENINALNDELYGYVQWHVDCTSYSPEEKQTIEAEIDYHLNTIGTRAIPKNGDISVVISANFADWFLCSTEESWSSCLSLNTDYEYAYWTGLPGLILNKSLFMVYVTNGNTKNWEGIEVEKFIARTWAYITEEGKVALVNWYPSPYVNADVINKTFGTDIFFDAERADEEWRSKYAAEFLYDENGASRYIYMDYTRFDHKVNAHEAVVIGDRGSSGHSFKNRHVGSMTYGDLFYLPYSLEYIIAENATVYDYNNDETKYCEECDGRVDEGYGYTFDGVFMCESCYNDQVVWTEDSGECWRDDAMYVESEGEYYTTEYVDRYFVVSEHNGE